MNWLLYLIVFISTFIQAITGFGYGIVSVPLLLLFMDTAEVLSIDIITATILIFLLALYDLKKVNLKKLLLTVPVSIIFAYVGVMVGNYIDDYLLKKILGVIMILIAIYFLIFSNKKINKPKDYIGVIMASFSGFLQGMVTMGGPPMAVYFLSSIDDKDEYYGTFASYFTGINISIVLMRYFNGLLTKSSFIISMKCMIPACIAIIIGKRLTKKLSISLIKKIIYIFMIIIGIYLIING